MDFVLTNIFVATALLITIGSMFRIFQKRRLPPGPWGLPFLGCLPFWKGPETNMKWYKRYGNIYSVKMGPALLVYLNSVSMVNKYLRNSKVFVDRPPGPAAIGEGILFGSGENWRMNRKICIQRLRSQTSVETFVQHFQEESCDLMAEIEKHAGKTFSITDVLRPTFVNALVSVIRGKRHDYKDPDFVKLVVLFQTLDEVDLMSLSTAINLKYPKLWALVSHTSPDLRQLMTEIATVLRAWIKQKHESTDGVTTSDDLLSLFLNSDDFQLKYSPDQEIVQTASDIINGGLVTSLSGMEFLFLYLIHHPQVQSKIQAEIDEVVGSTRKPSWDDMPRLPYTKATVLETLRLACVSPSTLPHVAVADSEIEGYHIPKGASVFASVYCIHRQPEVFDDPESFKPERHVSEDGTVRTFENMMPFGVEPRSCIGDQWFHVFAFMTLAYVLQRYDVCHAPDEAMPPFAARMRICRRLEPYNLVLNPRKPC